jgi:hypothetical protein
MLRSGTIIAFHNTPLQFGAFEPHPVEFAGKSPHSARASGELHASTIVLEEQKSYSLHFFFLF